MSSPANPPKVSSQKDREKQPSPPTSTPLPKGEYLRRLGPSKITAKVPKTPSKPQPLTPPHSSPYQDPHRNDNLMTPSTIKKMSVDEIIASYSKAREDDKSPAPEEKKADTQAQAISAKRKRSLQEASSLRYPSTGTRRNVKREFADLTGDDEDEPITYKAITEDEARKLSGLPPKEYEFPSLLDLLQD